MKNFLNKVKIFFKKHHMLFAIFFYAGLTFIFTYPLGFNFNSQLPKGGGDTYQALANIDLRASILHDLGFFEGLKYFLGKIGTYSPYVFLNLFFSKYAAYNIMFFLSYILSGLGAYLLAYYFVQRRGAALFAGTLFAFAPFHYYQTVAVHLGSMQQQWVPFAALFLLKFLDDFKFKNYLGFLAVLLLLAISEHQLLAFSLLFLLTIIIVKVIQNRELLKNKKLLTYLFSSILFFGMVVFFVFGDLLKVATSADNFLEPGMGAAKKYAMKPWEPLLPPAFHSMWPGINTWLRKTVGIAADNRDSYFVSFTAIALLLIFIWQFFRKKKKIFFEKKERAGLKLWFITFLVMYIFSWGPGIKIFDFDLPLPYYLVHKFLPFYDNIRVTGRMFMFAILALAILAAYAIKYLQPTLKQVFSRRNFVFILVIFTILEFWVAPIKTMSLDVSSFYRQIAKDKEAYKILEVPGSTDYEFASYKLFTNNIHKKQSVDGMALARSMEGQFNWQRTTPVVKQLLYTLAKNNDPEKAGFEVMADNYFTKGTDILSYNNIRYITLSKKYLEKETMGHAESFIEKYIQISRKYEDNYLVAYEVARIKPTGFYAKINTDSDQWSIDIKDVDRMAKKAGSGASISIFNLSQEDIDVVVKIDAKSAGAKKMVTSTGKEFVLTDQIGKYSFETKLSPGENIFELSVYDDKDLPIKINTTKKKKEGVLVYQINVKKR